MARTAGALGKKRTHFEGLYNKLFKGTEQDVLTRFQTILQEPDLKRSDELQILMWLGNKLYANPKPDDDAGTGTGSITIINQMPDADTETLQAASNTVRIATGSQTVQRIGAASQGGQDGPHSQ